MLTSPSLRQIIAKLAQAQQPSRWTPPPALYHELNQRLMQRSALCQLRQQVKNQLHALKINPTIIPAVQARSEALLATFEAQIEQIEAELLQLTETEGEWAKNVVLLQSISGIGLLTACWLVTVTLNFTRCERAAQLVQYAGLAPVARTSGSSVRNRLQVGGGGHFLLRAMRYMAALSASRFNAPLHQFYERLVARGKVPKLARCAVARKLLRLAFAIVKSGQPFRADYDPKAAKTLPELV